MVKFSFLNSLLDKPIAEAEKTVYLAGLKFESMPSGSARIALAVPGVIFLEHKDGKVTSAVVGDPMDLDDDSDTTK